MSSLWIWSGLLIFILAIVALLSINTLITVIRFPIGISAIVVVALLYLLVLPIEAALLVVALPFAAVTRSREAIKKSWIGSFPNSLRGLSRTTSNLWGWITSDTEETLERG